MEKASNHSRTTKDALFVKKYFPLLGFAGRFVGCEIELYGWKVLTEEAIGLASNEIVFIEWN